MADRFDRTAGSSSDAARGAGHTALHTQEREARHTFLALMAFLVTGITQESLFLTFPAHSFSPALRERS
jgi:hypothetical protein